MIDSRDGFSDHHLFSQRSGYKPLPRPMRLEEISEELSLDIYNEVRELFSEMANPPRTFFFESGSRFIERIFGKFHGTIESYADKSYDDVMNFTAVIVFSTEFHEVLDFLEIVMNDTCEQPEFSNRIKESFEQHGAAYRLDMSRRPYRFFPCSSQEQGDAAQEALAVLRQGNMDGASTHLRYAAEHINARKYGDSIADSIHAVESVARVIDPKSSKTLGPALKSIEDAGLLKHQALKEAFSKLYGYTNTEQGIRHALVDQTTADVGLDEALFMFGVCASFAAYLTNKHRQAQRQGPDSQ